MPKISAGLEIRDFSLPCSDGTIVSPLTFRGKWTILYFYPKDDTSGCTTEACNFRDNMNEYRKRNVLVYGVSPDDLESHEKFITKNSLPFPLLSDTSHEMLEDYGVWQEKSMYGRKYFGVVRTTFVINKDGELAKIFEKVKPEGHNKEVIEILKGLS